MLSCELEHLWNGKCAVLWHKQMLDVVDFEGFLALTKYVLHEVHIDGVEVRKVIAHIHSEQTSDERCK
jgi:hypothetical protein